MKVSVWQIVVEHVKTLRNDSSNRMSIIDILMFFGIPVFGGILGYTSRMQVSKDLCNASVSFFGVFVALLLNFQVAAFGIYNRKRDAGQDEKLSLSRASKVNLRNKLLQEVNANISYLVVVSIFALTFLLSLYVTQIPERIVGAFLTFTYVHFILNLLMVVKRSHVLFKMEYDDG